jgi:hypothetical protein
VHVGDLDGRSISSGGSSTVEVTILVHNNSHAAVANATVTGNFSSGYKGTGSCTTDASGVCRISSGPAAAGSTAIVFTVTNISYSGSAYGATSNHDPDGESNGTAITVLIN